MLVTSTPSSSSDDSSSSDSDNDREQTTNSKAPPASNHRKRKLSLPAPHTPTSNNHNHNHNSHNTHHSTQIDREMSAPPKKRHRSSNVGTTGATLSQPTHTGNNNNNNNTAHTSTNTNTDAKTDMPSNNDTANVSTKNLVVSTPTNNTISSNKSNKVKKPERSKKTKRKKTKSSSHAKPPKLDGVKIDDLNCIVCFNLPPSKIYQCVNSHLLCESCYGQIRQAKNCLCPQCRVRMSRSVKHVPRNKLAEKYLEAHLFDCEHLEHGCKEKVQFKFLKQHCNEECRYRRVNCKYCVLGCSWSGLAKDRSKHNKKCPIRTTEPKKILKLVLALNQQNSNTQKAKELVLNKYVQVAKMFETRARNISCKDLRVSQWNHNSKKTETVNSNVFVALHSRWQLQLMVEKVPNPKSQKTSNSNNNTDGDELNKLKVRLMCMRSVPRRVPLEICVLKGPDFGGYNLQPIQFEFEFTKNQRESAWQDLIPNHHLFSDEDVRDKFFTSYNSDNKLNLRIILVDKRANGPSVSFGGNDDNLDDGAGDDFDTNDFLSDELSDHDNDRRSHSSQGSHRNHRRRQSVSPDLPGSDASSDESSTDSQRVSDYSQDDDLYSDYDDYSTTGEYY